MKKVTNSVFKVDIDYYLTEEKITELKKLIIDNITTSEIGAKYFNIPSASQRTVNMLIDKIIGTTRSRYLEFTKIDLYLSLKEKGFSILDMARYEGTTGQVIRKRVTRFSSKMKDYYIFKEFEKSQLESIREKSKINNKLVPIDLYKPIIMTALFHIGKNKDHGRRFYFVPELGTWFPSGNILKSRLARNGIDYLSWECRWLLELDTDKIGTVTWAEKKVEYYYREMKYHTKQHIVQNLLKDSYYEPNYCMVKEDFVNDFIERRKEAGIVLYKFNFDLLPKEIKTVDTTVTIVIEEENPKTGIPYNETWETTYTNSVKRLEYPPSLATFTFYAASREERKQDFINKSTRIHDNKYGYHLVNYWDANTPVEIWCNTCQKSFFQVPQRHLEGQGCPTCRNNYFRELYLNDPKEMKKKLEDMYSPRYDFSKMVYTGCKNKIIVIDMETGIEFERTPRDLLSGHIGQVKESSGELLIRTWIEKHDIKYRKQVSYTDSTFTARATNTIVADFVIDIDNKDIIIEYHGLQHYSNRRNPWGRDEKGFELQKLRDEQLRNFCKISSNPGLIETPYILDTFEKVDNFLSQVIFDKIDPTTLIDYDELYK